MQFMKSSWSDDVVFVDTGSYYPYLIKIDRNGISEWMPDMYWCACSDEESESYDTHYIEEEWGHEVPTWALQYIPEITEYIEFVQVCGLPNAYIRKVVDNGVEIALRVRKGVEVTQELLQYIDKKELILDNSHPLYNCNNFEEWMHRFPTFDSYEYETKFLLFTGGSNGKWQARRYEEVPDEVCQKLIDRYAKGEVEVPSFIHEHED